MSVLLRMALRNVLKNWRHSLAAMLSIAAGVVALGLFQGYMEDLRSQYEEGYSRRNMLGDLIIEKAGAEHGAKEDPWKYLLEEPEQAFLEEFLARSDVVARVRFLHLSGLASDGRTSAVIMGFGFDLDEGQVIRGPRWARNLVAGRSLKDGGTQAVILGKSLGQVFDCIPLGMKTAPLGSEAAPPPLQCQRKLQLTTTTREGRLNALDTEVAGLTDATLKEIDVRHVAMSLPLAQRFLDTRGVSMYSVKLADPEDAEDFIQGLRAASQQRGLALHAVNWREHRLGELYRRGMDLLGLFRTFITLVVVIVAGMSVLNTLYKAVSERTREIGTLRSIGFLRRHVVLLFGLEGGILALLASLLGVLLTVPLALLLTRAGITYKGGLVAEPIPLVIALVPTTYALSVALLSAMAVAAAMLPASRAARMRIPDALGHS